MTEDDKQFLKEFLRGGGIVVVAVGLFILLASQIQYQPVKQQSTEIVGTYKGCDIIQWYYGPLAKYQYFLYCQDNGSQI